MTYQVGARNRGWLWEHRAAAVAVCLVVITAGSILLSSSLVPFFPFGLLLIAANVIAALVLAVLVLLWLSTTASRLPHGAEPAI